MSSCATRPCRCSSYRPSSNYVRDTVLLASVLFLVAIAQRFKHRGPRIGTDVVALVLVAIAFGSIAILPRLY